MRERNPPGRRVFRLGFAGRNGLPLGLSAGCRIGGRLMFIIIRFRPKRKNRCPKRYAALRPIFVCTESRALCGGRIKILGRSNECEDTNSPKRIGGGKRKGTPQRTNFSRHEVISPNSRNWVESKLGAHRARGATKAPAPVPTGLAIQMKTAALLLDRRFTAVMPALRVRTTRRRSLPDRFRGWREQPHHVAQPLLPVRLRHANHRPE
jgi:hypothetical protein